MVSIHQLGIKERTDERILGTGDFVNKMVTEADEAFRPQFSKRERVEKIERYTKALCGEKGVNIAELRSGIRRAAASKIRQQLTMDLVRKFGTPLAEIAKNVGVITPAISKALRRSSST